MTGSISAIGNSSSGSISNNSGSTKLTEETKKKLQALGIDTSNIKTEAEGQAALKEAMAKQAAANHHHDPSKSMSEKTIEDQAKSLASQMGVSVGNNDTLDVILSNISNKIDELQSSAGNDQTKLADLNNYKAKFATLSDEFSQLTVSRSMINNSLQGMANYNRASLGL